jgi:hypothetical protein
VDLDGDQLAQLANQEFDVDAGSAVDLGWIFARKDGDSHAVTLAMSLGWVHGA